MFWYTDMMNEATKKIDDYLASLPSWQKENLDSFRALIHQSSTSIIENWKWNVPVFLLNGKTLFAMSAFKAHTKYNFILNGALLDDSDKLFNNGFDSQKSRGVDLKENDIIDSDKLLALIQEAERLEA
jgi:hypothetical protein